MTHAERDRVEAALVVYQALAERQLADGLDPEREARRLAESYAGRERGTDRVRAAPNPGTGV